MSRVVQDKELEQYRNLMLPPDKFEDGFRWSSLLGAVFVALLMVPGAMYMQLVAGFGVGPAAQWVTVILFIEVARRAHKNLRRPELFVLFYMAGAVMVTPFSGILFRQFFVQSQAAHAAGVAEKVPSWFAPGGDNPAILAGRNFMTIEWLPAIGLIVFGTFISRLNNAVLGYGLFRVASDIEKLPFPMAPIGAAGIMALAEQSEEEKEAGEDSWRWRVFAIGGILGLVFGILYIGLPTVSGALLKKPIQIFPIPFSDWTDKMPDSINAVAVGWNWNIAHLVMGMVLPFFAMLGSFIGFLITLVANPILYHYKILYTWADGDTTVATIYKNNINFYFSFSIGVGIAIALMGFYNVYRGIRKMRQAGQLKKREGLDREADLARRVDRGDIKLPIVIGTYVITTMAYIVVSGFLIGWHVRVTIVLFIMGFLYTPLISYVTARLEGLAGQVIAIPMVREFAFILSGYRGGVDVWFLPIPMANYGMRTVSFRRAELTGTKFWSIWKAEIVLVPIVLISSIFFANFIWSLAEIPSPRYPYTERMWELGAAQQCIIYSSTLGVYSPFEEALNVEYIAWGAGLGMIVAAVLMVLKTPTMLFYGVVRGLNQTIPHVIVPQFVGACIARFYLERKMGLRWRQYAPVVLAGFTCGMGLITVFCVGITFLAKAVIQLPY